ncbi:MAG: ribonuclease J, partial [Candidatus Saccharimonas sp.]
MKKYNNSNAARVVRQNSEKVEQHLRQYRPTAGKIANLKPEILRIVPLGGQDGIGEKNMIVIEYEHDAIILDCGFDLGIDLPGINYAIPIVEYLEAIKHKIRAYVISHGHMDHIGALTHIVPRYPAPIYGSQFTIGMVETQFEKAQENGSLFQPQTETLDMDSHQRLHIGVFTIELVRVTHSIPESSAIIVDTPNGRLVNTGDFRLDPEPLDAKPSDIARLQQLGNEGVTLLMSESTNTTKLGRTPTEHSLQDSFYDL